MILQIREFVNSSKKNLLIYSVELAFPKLLVYYKIGGTYYEVSTSCGGSERLRDKMIRLIK